MIGGGELSNGRSETPFEQRRRFAVYRRLEEHFVDVEWGGEGITVSPGHLAFDGALWIVGAGIVRSPDNPSLNNLPFAVRRGFNPEDRFRFRSDVTGTLVDRSYYRDPSIPLHQFEYNEDGSFYVDNGRVGARVDVGHYISALDMIEHLELDPELVHIAARNITYGWLQDNPNGALPPEMFDGAPIEVPSLVAPFDPHQVA